MSFSDHSIDSILGQNQDSTCLAPGERQPRRRRTLYTREAIDKMEAYYEANTHPDFGIRQRLAWEFRVPEVKIQIWFQNRRSRRGQTKRRSNRPRKSTVLETKDCADPAPFCSTVDMSSWYPVHPAHIRGFLGPTLRHPLTDWILSHPPHTCTRTHRLQEILMEELRTYEASNNEDVENTEHAYN